MVVYSPYALGRGQKCYRSPGTLLVRLGPSLITDEER